jgi:endo-1,4-beta-xylanase
MKRIITFLLLTVFAFAGCSDEEDVFDGDWSGAYTSSSGGNQTLYTDAYGYKIGYEIWAAASSNLRLKWYGKDKRGGSAFKFAWKNSSNAIGRLGWFWDEGKPYTNYGDLKCDYEFTKSGTGGNFSYIGIYGWSRTPSLIEYYIVEDRFGSQLGTPYDCTLKGTFTVDGAVYRIYAGTRTNQPSIDGNKTFTQIFSVRQGPRQSGTISITEHFKKWAELGYNLGSMYEAKFKVEVGGGTGQFDASLIKFYKPE